MTTDFSSQALPTAFVENNTNLSHTIYLRALAPYKNAMLDYPLYEVSLRLADGVQRFAVSRHALLDRAGALGHVAENYVHQLLENIENPVQEYAGLTAQGRSLIMGIVNVTPDSFSDGGDNYDASDAIAHGKMMLEAGADILDVGGESTRPGAETVLIEEELRRVIPVIKGLKEIGATVSIDTRNAAVMKAAVEEGADIINDVTALTGKGALETAAKANVPVMLMHMQGEPQTMQDNPIYEDCALDIYDYLNHRIVACLEAGIKREHICIDPGIGFGKTLDHNMEVMNQLALYHGLGAAVLLGASRKSFIAKICGDVPAKDRLPGSLVAVQQGAKCGVQIMRVHDVAETKQALDVFAHL